MNESTNISWDELERLIDGACDQSLLADELAKLSRMLAQDPRACDHYIAYTAIHRELAWQMTRGVRFSPAELERYTEAERHILGDEMNGVVCDDVAAPSTGIGFFSNTWHGTIGFFSQEIPFALLMATFVTGLGLWLSSLVFVSHHVQMAQHNARPTPSGVGPDRKDVASDMEFVGQITGMVDVQWSDKQTATVNGANVFLGRRYALASGLMEISYDTGAKVILQGPVTYEVDSRDGGFLSVGKLTARLDNAKPQAADSKSSLSTIHAPLFTIRTPTATVTDLGTEFGVEVRPDRQEGVVVFQGQVRVTVCGTTANAAPRVQTLLAGQEATIDGSARTFAVEQLPLTSKKRFVRALPAGVKTVAAKSPEVAAGDRLVLWLKADALSKREDGEPVGNWPDSSGNLNNMYHIAMDLPVYVSGAKSGLNQKPAVRFLGREQLRGVLDIDPRTPGIQPLKPPFTLLSVVKNSDAYKEGQSVVRGYFGGGAERVAFGMNYQHVDPTNSFWAWTPNRLCTFGQANSINTNWNIHAYTIPDLPSGRWTWRCNGKVTGGVGLDSGKPAPYEEPVCVGTSGSGDENWIGDIAELMLYDRVLTEQELSQVGSYLARKYGISTAWGISESAGDVKKSGTTTPQEALPMKLR